jgi:uncharacterized protein
MYIERHITDSLKALMGQFPAVLVSGQRQVGKSTLLKHIAGEDYQYLSFDDPLLLGQARQDPRLFLMDHPGKLILDEIQLVPELMPLLKMEIDRLGRNGMYLLSGSQVFHLMRPISESLAGRIALLNLAGLSAREILGLPFAGPFIPSSEALAKRQKAAISPDDLWQMIVTGFYPRLHTPNANPPAWYAAYTATYIERDVRQLTNVTNMGDFTRFLSAVAARSGELLNYSAIAGDIGITNNTAKSWLNILETSGIICLLQPWSANHLKRALKTPKVYVMDTGLLAWLTRWPTAETVRTGAKAGQFFESYVIAEIIKAAYNSGNTRPALYFYRDKEQNEIDLIIQDGRTLYPVEIKMTAAPSARMAKAFGILPRLAAADGLTAGPGTILCQYPEMTHLKEDLLALPVQYL